MLAEQFPRIIGSVLVNLVTPVADLTCDIKKEVKAAAVTCMTAMTNYTGNRERCWSHDIAKAAPPNYCGSTDCAQEECCDLRDTCQVSDCSASHIAKVPQPDYCGSTDSAQEECCDSRDNCQVSD